MKKFILVILVLLLSSSIVFAQCGTASMYWVGDRSGGQPSRATASGRPLNDRGFTIAHKGLPLGSHVMVQRGSRQVEATVIDRGPFILDRIADLTFAIANFLGITRQQGVGHVCLNYMDGRPVPQAMGADFHVKKHHHHNFKKKIKKLSKKIRNSA